MFRNHIPRNLAALVCVLSLIGCGSSDPNQSKTAPDAQPLQASAMDLDGHPVTLAGIIFTPPSEWKDLGASGMRKADYTFGPVGNDIDSASVAVYFFGAESGGGVDANIQRWIGQMSMPDGTNPNDAATRQTYAVNGMTAHHVELTGIFNSGGPMMGGAVTPKDGYMMSAVVLEAPGGNVFFKLTGPETTARAMSQAFMSMLSQVKVAETGH